MIRVRKPKLAPAPLRTEGAAATKELRRKSPRALARGVEFDATIYGHAEVKRALVKAQHGKCCYCESKIRHVDHGDVEHFRPKASVRQGDGDARARPGYYWLAYAWDNLLFACALCNQRHKSDLFPLRDPAKRARSHKDDLSGEEPLLIDPSREDPARWLVFNRAIVDPVGGEPKGATTIRVLGLNRSELKERRRARLEEIERLEIIVREPGVRASLRAEAEAYLASCEADAAEYAAMTRAARTVGRSVSRR